MPVKARTIFLVLVLALSASCDAKSGAHRSNTTTTPESGVVALATARYAIGQLDVHPLLAAPANLGDPRTDGRRLFARTAVKGLTRSLYRLDPSSGAVLAVYHPRPLPSGSRDSALSWMVTDSGVVALDGDRKVARILDLDTLRVLRDVPLPVNSRSDISDDGTVTGPFWVGHRRFDYDELAGKETFMGVTRVVPAAGVPETRPVPPCGAANGVQPDARTLVINVECAYQIALIDLPTGNVTKLPSMLSRVDITLQGGQVWARWKNLGYIGRLDLADRRMTMLDLNAEGPLLSGVFGLHMDAGSIWVNGVPADANLPHITYRIDPRTVQVTARVWSNPVAILDGAGFTVSDDGRLETFDPQTIAGGAPSHVARPSTDPPKRFEPQSPTQQEVLQAFYAVFDPNVPNATAARRLPNDPRLLVMRSKLVKLARDVYKGVRIVVTDLAVQNGRASVSYTFELGSTTAFFPLSAQLVQTGTGWIVTAESICYLASAAAVGTC